jgi:aspartate racemase
MDSPARKHDGRKGWGELAAGGLEVIEVPGDHNTMISETHIGTLAEKLGECLQKAQASSTD